MPPKKSTQSKKSKITMTGHYKNVSPNEVQEGKKYTIELEPHPDHHNKTSITGKLFGKQHDILTGKVDNFGIEDEKTRELHKFVISSNLNKHIKNIKEVKARVKGLDKFTNKGLSDNINKYLGGMRGKKKRKTLKKSRKTKKSRKARKSKKSRK